MGNIEERLKWIEDFLRDSDFCEWCGVLTEMPISLPTQLGREKPMLVCKKCSESHCR